MSKLFELQANFLKHLEREQAPDGLSGDHRFDVYVRGYEARLQDSLLEDFPRTLAEREDPEGLISDYLTKHPSESWTLAELGTHFPQYLHQRFPKEPHLHQMAQKEWAHWLAFSIGQTPDYELKPANEDFILAVNPSLQIITGETPTLVYYFNGSTHELSVDPKWVPILEQSLEGLSFQSISATTELLVEDIVTQISLWSQSGVILGFR